ncbi:hypothetical protein QAD02_015328 [Eretmocerus hayati]|uniref:Uncharacterized protein n=1 Tax=Eretmocerus hayati TaxID=131215 RepID=A0ACC2P9L1_9HYME|nr:hypothetical protein QAD02_015328 [Eretmocerus hayati]
MNLTAPTSKPQPCQNHTIGTKGTDRIERHQGIGINQNNREAGCNCSGVTHTGMDSFTQMLLETRRDALASLKGALSNVATIAELVSSLNRQIDVAIGVVPAGNCLGNDPDTCTELLAGARRLLGDLAPTLNYTNSNGTRPPQQQETVMIQQTQTVPVDVPQQQNHPVRVKEEPRDAVEEEALTPPGNTEPVIDVDDSMVESQPQSELVRNVQHLPIPNNINRRSLQPMVRLGLLQDMIAEAEQEQRLRARVIKGRQNVNQQRKRSTRPAQRRSAIERELAELEERQREFDRRYRARQKLIQRKDKHDSRPRRILEPTPERQLSTRPARACKTIASASVDGQYVRPTARPTRSCVQQQQQRQKEKMELRGPNALIHGYNSRGSCSSSRRSSFTDSTADSFKTEDEAEPIERKVRLCNSDGGPIKIGLADISDD